MPYLPRGKRRTVMKTSFSNQKHDVLRLLMDQDNYDPWISDPDASVQCASGQISGRIAAVYSIDTDRINGAIGPEEAKEIIALSEFARAKKIPLVSINSALSPKIDTGLRGIEACERIVRMSGRLSELLPQIALVTENVLSTHGYLSTYADIIVANDSRQGTNATGHIVKDTIAKAVSTTRDIVRLLPQTRNHLNEGLTFSSDGGERQLTDSLCQDFSRPGPFDIKQLIDGVLDSNSFVEFDETRGQSIVTGIGSLIDQSVGICANQTLNGAPINDDALRKIIEITRLCDRFSIPLINLIDTTDETTQQTLVDEHGKPVIGNSAMSIRHGSALLHARQMMSPCVSLIVRRCYGSGYLLTTATRPHHVILAVKNAQFSRYDNEVTADTALEQKWIKKIIKPEALVEELVHWVRWSRAQRSRVTEQLHPNDPMRYNLNLNEVE